ncbi:MAG TPA: hypothetical protein VFA30_02675 [Gaiellaceae bacterium]|nr:hypothetical protein [Gaiellaceae bacterium]
MSVTTIDAGTGVLLVDGKRVFPLGLSDAPPVDGTAPNGRPAWAEIASVGVNFARNYTVWSTASAGEDLLTLHHQLDVAEQRGLQMWVALAGVDNNLGRQALLEQLVSTIKSHPGLGAWKGADEPAHGHVPAEGVVEVHALLKQLDPDHPVAIIEAPRAPSPKGSTKDRPLTVAAVKPYADACDIHGVDIYPVSEPPGLHAGRAPVNTDISVVGDMTRILARASPGKPLWTTLQIAWSGVLPPHPLVFPTLPQARFMAYDAIVAGARGLFFFGGHLTHAMNAQDRARGWNWTYWDGVQRPLLEELSDTAHTAALTAARSSVTIKANAADVAVSVRETDGVLYLIAVRRSPRASGTVRFTGLPASVREGTVLAHPGGNPARSVAVSRGAFTDPAAYAPHNARVYRFATHA